MERILRPHEGCRNESTATGNVEIERPYPPLAVGGDVVVSADIKGTALEIVASKLPRHRGPRLDDVETRKQNTGKWQPVNLPVFREWVSLIPNNSVGTTDGRG